MTFQKEADFEEALIKVLADKGWEKEVIKNPTEQDLIRNWARILYDNNRGIDRLNNYPLTDGEMQQIIEQITELRTPLKLNGFINGKTVSIKRDNPDDKLHFGTEISLKIYDRREIAAGQSRYQIVQQPAFPSKSKMLNDRRGDLMLLINGMPVIHIELKRSGVPVSQAYNQIEKYSYEGVFTGLFSLVQVFVAMNPEETRYFANPGPDGKFNTDYYFHWADFNNEPINDWKAIASSLLSIPMAHQLIGFYTVADNADGVLKVMRSYQYYAASAISDVVSKTKWDSGKQRGGYIWHTTGSGKTMTSFKSAQLIANSNDADKVIFLTDRIELGTQSLKEYRAFADENETVQATENTYVLLTKLKSNATADTLIVTSIQKMSNIRDEDGGLNASDIEIINGKRLVFIVDEAHRSTFGDIPYDLVGYLTEIDTGVIDADYMNSRFDKYLKLIRQEGSSEESIEQAKAELHKTFAALTQEEQKYANIFLHDIERGDVIAEDGKTLRDYITEYQFRAKDDQIHRFATIFGLDEDKLRNMMGLNLNEATINEFGRFDELKKSVDKTKAKAFFEAYEQTKLIPPKVNMKTDQLLRQFILTGGFEVDVP